ncbi:MAG: acetate--CoA ligase family protein [Hyphomicrobiaceae bacterium]|nr:acetate--CoA ligase family protein [Hyphomicrobiaceae bacterium]
MRLERLFHPRGIAIIGASADLTRIGGHPVKALTRAGYAGGIFPVNPKYAEIAGRKCYPDVAAIDGPCDVAIVAVPARAVAEAVRACGKAGIGFAIVLTAGFRETGAAGAGLEAELKTACAEAGVRVIGPNCQGVVSVEQRMWAVFGSISDEVELRPGRVSCAFQSGGFGYAIVNLAEAQGVGFRYCVSTGNETDITMPELLADFLDDPGTDLVLGVLEGTADARALLDLGRKSLQLGKPVLIWKCAVTDAGVKAAASHTANLTGSHDLYRAAFRQSGIIEVDDVEPIVDLAKLVAQGRWPAADRVGVLSISGGSGIVYADRAVSQGLVLPEYSPATVAELKSAIPTFGSVQNPTDVTAGVFNDMTILTRTLEVALADPRIDQLSVLLASIPGPPALRAADAIAAAAAASAKPVHIAWSGRRSKSEPAYAALEAARIAVVPTPVRLATAAARLARFARDRRRLLPRVPPEVGLPAGLELPEGAGALSEVESKAVLAACGVPATREVLVRDEAELEALTRDLAGPFAVKIVSPDIAHKTEIGGVRLGVAAGPALAEAFRAVVANARAADPSAQIDGVLVAEMATGLELLVGAVDDPGFGPAVALGLGGVLAEVLRDVTHRIAPFDLATAHDMIGELRGAPLLDGYRGSPPRDRDALAELLVRVSVLAAALGPRLEEMDINPVFLRERGQGAVAADALIVLR